MSPKPSRRRTSLDKPADNNDAARERFEDLMWHYESCERYEGSTDPCPDCLVWIKVRDLLLAMWRK
jgi:hypothetical protein